MSGVYLALFLTQAVLLAGQIYLWLTKTGGGDIGWVLINTMTTAVCGIAWVSQGVA